MFQKIIFLTFFCLLAMNVFGKSGYEKDWQKVDSLFQIRQYQSALTIVKSIYAKADKESNADQQVKSVVYQIFLMNYLEDTENPKNDEDQDEGLKFFAFLDKEIAKAKSPVKPILHVLAAKSYWAYYEENQYEIQDRSNTQNFNNQDIKTWTLQNFVDRIQSHFTQSLKEKTLLQQTPINTFFEVLGANANEKPEDFAKKQNLALRPTLYDLVIDQAIDFFANTQIDLPKPAYAFEINKAEYYADYQEFNKINLASKDSNNSKLMVLQLFQEVLKFHDKDSDPKVLADFELKRILFVHEHSVIENKDQIYEKALNQMATKFKSAEAEYLIAEIYRGKNDLVKAFQLAQELIKKYPNEIAAIKAKNMILDIKSKNLSLSLPQYNPTLRSILSNLSYRNLTNLTCKIVVRKDDDMEKLNDYRLEKSEDRIKEIFARKSVRQWNIKLPESADFQQHKAEMKIPDLDLGQYLIVIVDSSSLELKRTIAYQVFDVSNLMFTQRTSKDGGNEFYVLDRNSGQAVPNVQTKATKYTYDYRNGKYDSKTIKSDPTDKDGYVKIQAWEKTQNQYGSYDYSYLQVDFLLGKDKVSTANATNTLREKPDYLQKNAFFFMDRGIYRPSQTIYFKAVLLENRTGKRTILQKQKVEVKFYDVNSQVIARQELTSNDYGTISGTFTAPQGVLNGNMRIEVDGFSCNNNGFSVEEYKRPKFEVKIENPKESFKLGDLVKVKANAVAFSGAKITDAKAVFRVVRKTNLPYWYAWYYPSISVADMEIAKGELKTNENGEAIIEFTAIPDLSVSKDGEPVFNYEISVDVTDLNGETQSSATTVSVGYKALMISTNIYEKVNKDDKNIFSISTKNLSGEDQIAKGNYSIFRLKSPEKLFRERRWNKPDQFLMDKNEFYATFPTDVYDQENDQSKWERQLITTSAFSTPEKAVIDLAKLDQGVYFLEIKSQDQAGENVQSSQYFTVFSEKANKLPFLQTFSFQPLKVSGEPKETAKFLIGTSYRNAHILYEIEHENEIVEKKWLKISEKQELLEIPILEKYRGNFGFHITFVMEDRVYQHSQTISVPYSNKELDIEFETFRNKLLPNEKERWKIKIKGKKGEKTMAEMVATMYDASLDAFRANNFDFNALDYNSLSLGWSTSQNFNLTATQLKTYWNLPRLEVPAINYPALNTFGIALGNNYNRRYGRMEYNLGAVYEDDMAGSSGDETESPQIVRNMRKGSVERAVATSSDAKMDEPKELLNEVVVTKISEKKEAKKDLDQVKARTNLNETAFFYPNLQTDSEGNLVIDFQMPEALTRWKMLGFAHTTDLKYGFAQKELITQKELMVVPNQPRFFRENDKMQFSVKITNLSDKDLKGQAKLLFFDALTMKTIDPLLFSSENLAKQNQNFEVKKGQNTVVNWEINIPDAQTQAITFRAVAQADNFSDGEEMALPVLTNRMMVTESLPLYVNGNSSKNFSFKKLAENTSSTLKNHKLTLEMTSNPAWYAVQALPYLMEYPYECAEQTFSRFYANSIATSIANKSPKIKQIFESWKNVSPDALVSNLQKNQELKNLLLEETPWVIDAQSETASKQRLALLFDLNKMASEQASALNKLTQMQMNSGAFPWFTGMREDRWVTQYIVAGLGKLGKMGIETAKINENVAEMTQNAVSYLDTEIVNDYEELEKSVKKGYTTFEKNNLGHTQIHYLYVRSFFLDQKLDKETQKVYDYYLSQLEKYWTANNNLYSEGMAALILHRNNKSKTVEKIMKSLRERALHSEELGMFWKYSSGYYWYEAPTETQVLMIELFTETKAEAKEVEDMKTWLLKNKQTNNWETTKATAEACYALLMGDSNWLASDELVEITMGGKKIDPKSMANVQIEAGTGYFKTSWDKAEISKEMGNVSLKKNDAGIAWGAMYWQYFEQLDKITPAKTPLSLKKQLFLQTQTDKGIVIVPIDKQVLKVGDLLTVRIELRVDREMEYVHLKDMRAAGLEPTNVMSGYRYQGGLGYYESTKDAATNFFIGNLPKGTYVFEYPLRVSQKGDFSNGITTIQCMYAPEFSSHSEGIRIRVE